MERKFKCEKCGAIIITDSGYDTECTCGAIYNCFGQRLRDNIFENPVEY